MISKKSLSKTGLTLFILMALSLVTFTPAMAAAGCPNGTKCNAPGYCEVSCAGTNCPQSGQCLNAGCGKDRQVLPNGGSCH